MATQEAELKLFWIILNNGLVLHNTLLIIEILEAYSILLISRIKFICHYSFVICTWSQFLRQCKWCVFIAFSDIFHFCKDWYIIENWTLNCCCWANKILCEGPLIRLQSTMQTWNDETFLLFGIYFRIYKFTVHQNATIVILHIDEDIILYRGYILSTTKFNTQRRCHQKDHYFKTKLVVFHWVF